MPETKINYVVGLDRTKNSNEGIQIYEFNESLNPEYDSSS